MPPDFQTERAGSPDETPDRPPRPGGPLIYLAAPFSDPNPEISKRRLKHVNRYAVHLLSRGTLAFSPLSHGAPLESPDIPSHVWYELGLRIMEGCDELYLLKGGQRRGAAGAWARVGTGHSGVCRESRHLRGSAQRDDGRIERQSSDMGVRLPASRPRCVRPAHARRAS